MDEREQYKLWLSQPGLDERLRSELKEIENDEEEINDRFYKNLEFGTGGLRGVIGAGTNRMNVYTVSKATRGLAEYIKEDFSSPSCAIAYDSRNFSLDFAKCAAACLAEVGVSVFIFEKLMPTPMLSFAVRHLKLSSGIVITASHNPAKYNGYKVYGADGCQITLEAAAKTLAKIEAEPLFTDYLPDFDKHLKNGDIRYIGEETINAYYEAVLSESVCRPQNALKVIYSPLNGTGNVPVRHILSSIGNVEVNVVAEQEAPNGNFPTCPFPNPEIEEAMRLSLKLLKESGADFCIATDPDCDRVGTAALDKEGNAVLINGNEMGVMLLDFICARRKENGSLPNSPVAVTTIVSTPMAKAVAERYGVETLLVLTGFKFIGEQIGLLEKKGEEGRFIFGFEESYGYLSGAFVRDKDAVNASMLICEMASYYKGRGMSLIDVRDMLYEKYGYYHSALLNKTFEGEEGMQMMKDILNRLRECKPKKIGSFKIESVIDYAADETSLPKSDVLSYSLDGGCSLVVRPSGTEPKLKMYLSSRADCSVKAEELCEELKKAAEELINQTQAAL